MMNRVVVTALIAGLALPALAQDAVRDWDLTRDDERKIVIAHAALDNGLSLAVRCVDGSLEALLAGLPELEHDRRRTRPLEVAFGDDEMSPETWNVTTDAAVAISDYPAPFARNLRKGGRLQIRVPGGGGQGRSLRYDLTLPPSNAAIDQVLTTCGRPLEDPRDQELKALGEAGLPANVRWERQPRPEFPSSSRYARGFAVASCVTTESGALRDCAIESEHPQGQGFGEATLRAIRRARTAQTTPAGENFRPVMVAFRSDYIIDGYQTREDMQRQRQSRADQRARREQATTPDS